MVTKFFDMVKLMLYKYRKQIISILAAIPLLWGIYLLVKPDTDIHIAVVGPMSGKDSANGKSYLEGVKPDPPNAPPCRSKSLRISGAVRLRLSVIIVALAL